MKRTTRNTIIAICCTGMFAAVGCQSSGELSVTGLYSNQGQALSGDECDQLLLDAANADSADGQDAAKEAFRECVEETLGENGQHAECRDDEDTTCDIILEEIGDTIARLHQEGSTDLQPQCDANTDGAGAEAALCHLMAAYEACELDRNDDGDPDVEPCDATNSDGDRCQPPPPPHCEAGADGTDRDCNPEMPPECRDGNLPEDEWNAVCNPNEPPRCDADNPDSWANGQCEPGGTDPNEPTCDEIRDFASQAGEQDREFLERERPECFDPNGEPGTEPGGEPGTDPNNTQDQFCQDLLEQIQTAPDDQSSADLREVYERECVNR